MLAIVIVFSSPTFATYSFPFMVFVTFAVWFVIVLSFAISFANAFISVHVYSENFGAVTVILYVAVFPDFFAFAVTTAVPSLTPVTVALLSSFFATVDFELSLTLHSIS